MSIEKIELGADIVTKLTGLSAEELKARFEGEDGELLPAEKQAETFAELINARRLERERTVGKDQYNRGLREKGEAIEKALSPILEQFQIDDVSRAEDAISLLAEKIKKDEPGKPRLSELTPDQLQELPAYQQALKARENLQNKLKEIEGRFDAYKQEVQTKQLRSELGRHIRRIFQEKKANIGSSTLDDAAEFFLNGLNLSHFTISDNGQPVPLSSDGVPLTDDFGNPVPLETFVEKKWPLGFNVADPSKAGANPPNDSKKGPAKYNAASRDEWVRLIESKQGAERADVQRQFGEWLRSQR